MPNQGNKKPRRGVRSAAVIGISLVVGLGLGGASWGLRATEPWWSNIFANAAVVILLLIPGELLLGQLRTKLERTEERAGAAEGAALSAQSAASVAKDVAAAAQVQAQQAVQSLEQIQQRLTDRQKEELQSEIDRYRSPLENLSRQSLLETLRTATRDELITAAGVRSPVWQTDLHYRYVLDDPERGELSVNLEEDDGTVLSVTVWEPGRAPEDFFQLLVEAVRDAGRDLGTGLNLPTESVERLLEMLAEVTRLRSQGLRGYRHTLRRIIERSNGWYFTEENVVPEDNLYYVVAVSRLGEPDWSEHLREKGWYTAPWAIDFARRMYGVTVKGATW
ncbi:hypothetical protein [Microbacterium sp. NPDC087591]|uniref:hypothetical protein n=1 Tax=Microbacterium sp. NPDC087591 TaxID=3364192 RepID=UPI0037FE731C